MEIVYSIQNINQLADTPFPVYESEAVGSIMRSIWLRDAMEVLAETKEIEAELLQRIDKNVEETLLHWVYTQWHMETNNDLFLLEPDDRNTTGFKDAYDIYLRVQSLKEFELCSYIPEGLQISEDPVETYTQRMLTDAVVAIKPSKDLKPYLKRLERRIARLWLQTGGPDLFDLDWKELDGGERYSTVAWQLRMANTMLWWMRSFWLSDVFIPQTYVAIDLPLSRPTEFTPIDDPAPYLSHTEMRYSMCSIVKEQQKICNKCAWCKLAHWIICENRKHYDATWQTLPMYVGRVGISINDMWYYVQRKARNPPGGWIGAMGLWSNHQKELDAIERSHEGGGLGESGMALWWRQIIKSARPFSEFSAITGTLANTTRDMKYWMNPNFEPVRTAAMLLIIEKHFTVFGREGQTWIGSVIVAESAIVEHQSRLIMSNFPVIGIIRNEYYLFFNGTVTICYTLLNALLLWCTIMSYEGYTASFDGRGTIEMQNFDDLDEAIKLMAFPHHQVVPQQCTMRPLKGAVTI